MRKVRLSISFRLIMFLTYFVLIESGLRADTFIVRPPPTSRSTAQTSVGPALVGERYCTEARCIVVADTAAQVAALKLLESKGLASVREFPEARKVFFGNAIWDADTRLFDRTFAGDTELASDSPESLFAVVFKSFPEGEWLMALQRAGFVVTEPLPTMAYVVYGDRSALARFAAKAPYIRGFVEMPAGLRRFNIDTYLPDDGDAPASTLIALTNVSSSAVRRLLVNARGGEPPIQYEMNNVVAYGANLARADALYISRFPEVVSVVRQTATGGPSDERLNRIIAGDWQAADTAWPATGQIGANTQPQGQWYWDNYLSTLSSALPGFNLSNQTIGFLDTGVDRGLRDGGSDVCPPHLLDPNPPPAGTCRLVFTTDVTDGYTDLNLLADDHSGHGTMTSSLAAGYINAGSPGRDTQNYSFTQGTAQGARVAMTKFWGQDGSYTCDLAYRQVSAAESQFSVSDYQQRVRYAIVSMNGRNPLSPADVGLPPPGQPPPVGPGASIFNHSWNIRTENGYEAVSLLLDQTTRSPRAAGFSFEYGGTTSKYFGSGEPILHIVSAGNTWLNPSCPPNCNYTFQPGMAKNVLTVGASQNYNQLDFNFPETAYGCPQTNSAAQAVNTNLIGAISRHSPDGRFKPDLVVPGVRSYGRRSGLYVGGLNCEEFCNPDLTRPAALYAWDRGTSFSAAAASGAASIVREWLRVLKVAAPMENASPAMIKATLIAAARLRPSTSVPDQYQGFGGLALDTLFRSPASQNYFFFDQRFILPNQGYNVWEKTLTINPLSDVSIALAWTDRASWDQYGGPDYAGALVNNLNLRVQATIGGTLHSWYGNNFTTGCSTNYAGSAAPATLDSVNTAEKVLICAAQLAGATQITIRVSAESLTGNSLLTGDGLAWQYGGDLYPRQDFALAVINAHE